MLTGRLAALLLSFAVCAAGTDALAQSQGEPTVVVPNRVIYPGQDISFDALDVVPLRRNLPNPQAYAMTLAEFEGKVAARTLLPGRMVSVGFMRDAHLVEVGTPVQLIFSNGGLTIAATGVPLQAGAAGDVVRVRNLDSGRIVNGIVMGDGTIRVGAS